jgi:hypothetical protein
MSSEKLSCEFAVTGCTNDLVYMRMSSNPQFSNDPEREAIIQCEMNMSSFCVFLEIECFGQNLCLCFDNPCLRGGR